MDYNRRLSSDVLSMLVMRMSFQLLACVCEEEYVISIVAMRV